MRKDVAMATAASALYIYGRPRRADAHSPRAAAAAMLAVAVLAALGAAAAAVPAVPVPETTLLQVQALFRHGARTPNSGYPNDPYANETYMPFGPGHLTKRGRQLEFSLGQYLRRRYVAGEGASPLLGPEYFTGAVRVNTSAVERTQESAAAFLAGLFPPGRAQDWETDGSGLGERWLPIPYHIVPEDQDRALIGSAPCPAKDADVQRVYDDPGYRRRVLDALGGPDVLHYIRTRAGLPERGLSGGLYQVFSNLQCQEDLHLTLPEWSRPVYPEPLRSAANLWLKAFSYTPRLRRLSFGDLTTGVLHAARTHGQQPRLLAYSAHDSTLAAALQAFHLEPQDPAGDGIPEFSACLLFELHRDAAGTLGLQIFYRREPGGPLVRMIPEGCGAFCPLDALEAMMQAHGELPQPGDDCDDVGDVGAEAAGRLADVHLGHVRGVVVGGL